MEDKANRKEKMEKAGRVILPLAAGILTDLGKCCAAIVGFLVAIGVGSFFATVAWRMSGLPGDHPSVMCTTLAAFVVALWAWWRWVKPMWKRFDLWNPLMKSEKKEN